MRFHVPPTVVAAIAIAAAVFSAAFVCASPPPSPPIESPVLFSRHVAAVFSRLGCNGGACHGAVQGKNGFRLSLFAADAEQDYLQIVRAESGRRVNRLDPERSLLLLKASGQVPHGGGRVAPVGSFEYEILRRWLASGAKFDDTAQSHLVELIVTPGEQVLELGATANLRVSARFADGGTEDVTALCGYESLDDGVVAVDAAGTLRAAGVGDAAVLVRFRAAPVAVRVLVARAGEESLSDRPPQNFIDRHILAKLRQLNLPPAELADDATFLRRVRLDVTGQLPSPDEVRAFLADGTTDKRQRKIDELLAAPGYAALWTLKFCDLLRAADYGVYADNLAENYEAPRFQAWVRARLAENVPYDEFAARIVGATSRDGRSREEYAEELIALQEGYATPRHDLEVYARRRTLDIYWQRRDAVGLPGALQVAHAFLGLRLECAQCHRHPYDVWRQHDLLSFANFFTRVRTVGFQGDNEQRFPEEAKLFAQYSEEGKRLTEEAGRLKEQRGNALAEEAGRAQEALQRLTSEIAALEEQARQFEEQAAARRDEASGADAEEQSRQLLGLATELEAMAAAAREEAEARRVESQPHPALVAENEKLQREIAEKERRGRLLADEVAVRMLHAQVFHRTDADAAGLWASVTSPLGTQTSNEFRLLGSGEALDVPPGEDPRQAVVDWLRRPDNPYFARAIVNRVWAHYFGRGIVDPPDDLSPFNPPSHPELLDELCRGFIENGYDLKWLHRAILNSGTYQQSGTPRPESATDRTSYASFPLRRLPAEVLLDALDQATGTRERMDMEYYHWPEEMRCVDLPYKPQNRWVAFVLEQFGRPARNSAVQCDCERQSEVSLLQVLSLANHPRVWQKIADPTGRVAALMRDFDDSSQRVSEMYLAALGRPPDPAELAECLVHVEAAENAEEGLRTVLWALLNTREFLLQH